MEPQRDTRPFSGYERMLALRYLRARRKEGFISVIAGFSFFGIMLGVATLIIVMAVMNGFRSELLGKILSVNGHVIVQGNAGPLTDFDAIARRIGALDDVVQAVPLLDGQVMASSPRRAAGALLRGIRGSDLAALETVSGNLRAGTLREFDKSRGIAIGSRLAINLGLAVGDKLTLISPRGPVTPFGVTPQIKAYPVVAVFQIGMSQYDEAYIFMPLANAQVYLRTPDAVSAVEVMIVDPERARDLRPAIVAAAGKGTRVTTWQEQNSTFFNALQVERNVMFLILALIVLVASLNMISGLIMLVKDKSRDIAILRSMGAGRGAIMRVFFMTGAAIGMTGTIAGVVIGVLFCWNIEAIRQFVSRLVGMQMFSPELYYLSQLPAEIDTGETVGVIVMALTLAFIATLYPSWRAARLDPVEALRYE